MLLFSHQLCEIAKLTLQIRGLKFKDIKKFVQGHLDLGPEFRSLGSQNQVYHMIPLRNLYPGETQLVQK